MIPWQPEFRSVPNPEPAFLELLQSLHASVEPTRPDLVRELRSLGAQLARERTVAPGRRDELEGVIAATDGSLRESVRAMRRVLDSPDRAASDARGLATLPNGSKAAVSVAVALDHPTIAAEFLLAPAAELRRTTMHFLTEPVLRGDRLLVRSSLRGILRATIEDPEPQVRRYAALLAWSCDEVDAILPRLLEGGRSDDDLDARGSALESLARARGPESLALLLESLASANDVLATAAARSLGRRESETAMTIGLLDDPRRDVRRSLLAPLAERLAGVSMFEFTTWVQGRDGRSEAALIAKVRDAWARRNDGQER